MTTDRDRPMLICYDGSEDAKHAIERAATLVGRGRQAVVVTVWQPTADTGSMVWSDVVANMSDFVELDRAASAGGNRLADEGARIARAAGIEAEPIAVKATGPVWRTIVEVADDNDAAVIVIGSRGHTGIRSLLLGSVSNAVVHHAHQPTLVIHLPAHDSAVAEASR